LDSWIGSCGWIGSFECGWGDSRSDDEQSRRREQSERVVFGWIVFRAGTFRFCT